MDLHQPQNVIQLDSEVSLLLANIDAALRELGTVHQTNGALDTIRVLEQALATYGSIKHLVPKLNLGHEQQALVKQHLLLLRARIIASDPTLSVAG